MRRLLGLVVAAVAATMLFALSARQALAATVRCGDVLKQDTTLDSDLASCPDSYWVLRLSPQNSPLTLDLNGHTLDGHGEDFAVGLYIDTADAVLVENGTLEGFQIGAVGGQVTFRNMLIRHNNAGIGVGSNTVVEDSSLSDNYVGITGGGVVRRSVLKNNEGFGLYSNSGGSVESSEVSDNGYGIALGAAFGKVQDSRIADNAHGGIYSYAALLLDGNVIERNGGDGIFVLNGYPFCPALSSIVHNSIDANGGDGVHVERGGCPTLEQNHITGNHGDGVSVGDVFEGEDVIPSLTTATLTGNDVSANALNGIDVKAGTIRVPSFGRKPPYVSGNTANRNGDSGIAVQNPSTEVVGNHTWWNNDLGIEAVPGTLGGDNWAKHNGNPLQCVPVSLCSTTGKPKG
jgi:hypothetical protein